jgi:hypothetical protein
VSSTLGACSCRHLTATRHRCRRPELAPRHSRPSSSATIERRTTASGIARRWGGRLETRVFIVLERADPGGLGVRNDGAHKAAPEANQPQTVFHRKPTSRMRNRTRWRASTANATQRAAGYGIAPHNPPFHSVETSREDGQAPEGVSRFSR